MTPHHPQNPQICFQQLPNTPFPPQLAISPSRNIPGSSDSDFPAPQKLPQFHSRHRAQAVSLALRRKKTSWTPEENLRLRRLHDELGNRWSTIARSFQAKTENDVKNNFFSQLRMSLRHLNKTVASIRGAKMQPIKTSVLYRIIASCEEGFRARSKNEGEVVKLAQDIKTAIFNFLNGQQENTRNQAQQLFGMIKLYNTLTHSSAKNTSPLRLPPPPCYHSETPQLSNYNQEGQAEEEASSPEQSVVFKIQCMKTMEMEEQPKLAQLQSDLVSTPSQMQELIARPPICLQHPFEQVGWLGFDDSFSYALPNQPDQQSQESCPFLTEIPLPFLPGSI